MAICNVDKIVVCGNCCLFLGSGNVRGRIPQGVAAEKGTTYFDHLFGGSGDLVGRSIMGILRITITIWVTGVINLLI